MLVLTVINDYSTCQHFNRLPVFILNEFSLDTGVRLAHDYRKSNHRGMYLTTVYIRPVNRLLSFGLIYQMEGLILELKYLGNKPEWRSGRQ